jgi:hypothetical protein
VTTETTPQEAKVIHTRLAKFLEDWIQNHFYDFQNDPEMVKTLQNFVDTIVATSDIAAMTTTLHQAIDEKLHESHDLEELTGANAMTTKHFLDIPPSDLANQLTLIAYER